MIVNVSIAKDAFLSSYLKVPLVKNIYFSLVWGNPESLHIIFNVGDLLYIWADMRLYSKAYTV